MGGAVKSIPGRYLAQQELDTKQVTRLCKDHGIEHDCIARDVLPLLSRFSSRRGRITRMQLLWAWKLFDRGKPGDYLQAISGAKQSAFSATFGAANAALRISQDAELSRPCAMLVYYRSYFTMRDGFLNWRQYTDAKIAAEVAAAIAYKAVAACQRMRDEFNSEEWRDRMAKLWNQWRAHLYKMLQEHVVQGLSRAYRKLIKVDIINGQIILLEGLNFHGGTADIMDEDSHILDAITHVIQRIYDGVGELNDQLEVEGKERVLQMPHLRFEGHVQKTSKSIRASSMLLSQRRAERVVNACMRTGVPLRFLHAQGFGYDRPVKDGEDGRRVEIKVMTPDELDDYIKFVFNKYDGDGSGYLGESEVIALGKEMGKSKEEILYQLVYNFDDEFKPGAEVEVELDELQQWFKSSKALDPAAIEKLEAKRAQQKLEQEMKARAQLPPIDDAQRHTHLQSWLIADGATLQHEPVAHKEEPAAVKGAEGERGEGENETTFREALYAD